MFVSIFNDVLGPVMRGPSSSHTAGSFHIGRTVRDLLGGSPLKVKISFDRNGSYGATYVQQGVDQAFITGLMGWKQTDEIFTTAIENAKEMGVAIEFMLTDIPQADHPNYVIIEAENEAGSIVEVEAKSVGGGTFKIIKVNGNELLINGKQYETLMSVDADQADEVGIILKSGNPGGTITVIDNESGGDDEKKLLLSTAEHPSLKTDLPLRQVLKTGPVYRTQKGEVLFSSATELVSYAQNQNISLGECCLRYESEILGMTRMECIKEMLNRYQVMKNSVLSGFDNDRVDMLLLSPMAGDIQQNIRENRVAIGGLHSKAGAAAMAAMHTCNSRGVVCAAPTGGAAGTLPGVLTAMEEEFNIDPEKMALMMFAAGGIGLILAIRATFAAEVAGCQVEIGAAGAMAGAAVVEYAGGTALQACDTAAISFQNTMGSVCDLVQGMCELPCHTRNAAAASSAFTNADMILGGYINHIDLDQTIDAVYSSGKMLPEELRCTARGGLALAPSAISLEKQDD